MDRAQRKLAKGWTLLPVTHNRDGQEWPTYRALLVRSALLFAAPNSDGQVWPSYEAHPVGRALLPVTNGRPSPGLVSRGALWFGLLGGAIAWTCHLLLAYTAAEFGCVGRLGEQAYMEISLVAWIELALTAVLAVIGGTATLVAYRSYLRLGPRDAAEGREAVAIRTTARAGVLTSGLFTLVILFESIPILFYLQSC